LPASFACSSGICDVTEQVGSLRSEIILRLSDGLWEQTLAQMAKGFGPGWDVLAA
jgi:hypothetical protein